MISKNRFRRYYIMNSWSSEINGGKEKKEIIRSQMQFNSSIYALSAYSHGSVAIYDPNFGVRWFEYVIFEGTLQHHYTVSMPIAWCSLSYNKLQIQMSGHTHTRSCYSQFWKNKGEKWSRWTYVRSRIIMNISLGWSFYDRNTVQIPTHLTMYWLVSVSAVMYVCVCVPISERKNSIPS